MGHIFPLKPWFVTLFYQVQGEWLPFSQEGCLHGSITSGISVGPFFIDSYRPTDVLLVTQKYVIFCEIIK